MSTKANKWVWDLLSLDTEERILLVLGELADESGVSCTNTRILSVLTDTPDNVMDKLEELLVKDEYLKIEPLGLASDKGLLKKYSLDIENHK